MTQEEENVSEPTGHSDLVLPALSFNKDCARWCPKRWGGTKLRVQQAHPGPQPTA